MIKNNNLRNIAIWVAILLAVVISFNMITGAGLNNGSRVSINFSDFLNKVDNKQISNVTIQGRTIDGVMVDGTPFTTYSGEYPELITALKMNDVTFDIVPPNTRMNSLFSIFVSWFPMVLLIGVWIFFMKQMQKGGGKTLGFGKSKARLLSESSLKVKFKDVAGIDEAKEELSEIVEFLRDPAKFKRLGGNIPKGCLLIGPPGCGKTLLAKAIAGEANVAFFSISGSDFVEMFVGVGASRVRDMFEQGKRSAPCIIFIDEIDAVGRNRGVGLGGGNDEREQTLNQLLVEMDGFESNEGVVIIAATNRPDVLDPALLRPGRFDRQITVSDPDVLGREKILNVHLKKIKHEKDLDPKVIAKSTPGFSGAELANLVNEAALLAARRNKKFVTLQDLEDAKDKVIMGVAQTSRIIKEEDKKITAYHEAGHAIITLLMGGSGEIHKATIIPRGRSLGAVHRLPGDQTHKTKEEYISDITIAAGGRAAEEIIFGAKNVTSGAYADIKAATQTARAMISMLGMSDIIGFVFHGKDDRGQETVRYEYTAQEIDKEVKKLVQEKYDLAKGLLQKHSKELHLVAESLIQHETLTGKQLKNLFVGNPIDSNLEVNIDSTHKEETTLPGLDKKEHSSG